MKRRMLVLAVLPVLVFALAGVAQAGQGRMGGMSDPYGLVEDESDFLIHPAKIATGEGVKFYGYYRFTYTDVMEWDAGQDWFDPVGTLDWLNHLNTSGYEYGHDGLAGAAFPLGPGRMGVFFTYAGRRGDYDGDNDVYYDYNQIELTSALDDFAGRLLYALPMGTVKLGVEAQVAYRQEEKEYFLYAADLSEGVSNPAYWWYWTGYLPDYLPIDFFPYDSSYWEALFKGSLEAQFGPADVAFTLRGGFIFCGDNEWVEKEYLPVGSLNWNNEMDGDVEGWGLGGDIWMRYPLADGLALPFLVRVDYQEKTRDGNGVAEGYWINGHTITEKNLQLEVGGGLDKELSETTRIAGGIYYNYLQRKDNRSYFGHTDDYFWTYTTDFDTPELTEHRVVVRLTGEHELSPSVALRAGLNLFYGWTRLQSSYFWEETSGGPWWSWDVDVTADGSHWGLGASLGGTVRLNGFAFEPFITGGYQQLNLDVDGVGYDYGVLTGLMGGDLTHSEWYVSGGLSVLFDL